jgi:pimeloyl-ACP methyl ester carboxylesterase
MYVSIRIKGHLDPSWQEYLEGLEIVQGEDGTTRLSGMLQDQSALYGVLNMMSTLNLSLLSLERSEREQRENTMRTVISKDGTTIAFDKLGKGPALILVGGALEQRAMNSETAQLAPLLAEHFTVFHYDRRGRGDSTDTLPYAVEREIEDIEALITEAGGSAFVFGISSSAALAMEAAIKLGGKVKKLAMYEAPYNSDEAARQAWKTYRKQLTEVLAQGRRGDALALFMLLVGMPAEHLDQVHQHPMWPMWEVAAPTLAYDAAVMGEDASVPTEKAASVAVPALVMDGSASYPFMHVTALALVKAMPHAQHRSLPGQTHEVSPQVLAPVLEEFFNSSVA